MISTDEIRRLFRMPRDGRVTMAVVNAHDEVEDFTRSHRYWVSRPSTDTVFVFAGPRDKLKGTITYAGDEVKVEITFPNDRVETKIS